MSKWVQVEKTFLGGKSPVLNNFDLNRFEQFAKFSRIMRKNNYVYVYRYPLLKKNKKTKQWGDNSSRVPHFSDHLITLLLDTLERHTTTQELQLWLLIIRQIFSLSGDFDWEQVILWASNWRTSYCCPLSRSTVLSTPNPLARWCYWQPLLRWEFSLILASWLRQHVDYKRTRQGGQPTSDG
jgi:hypothetical protein